MDELSFWNVGGVSHCSLTLSPGLTVLTGESGAGKSSIVRAIELLAGKRAQTAVIRGGEEEAGVEAVFVTSLNFDDLDKTLRPEEQSLFARRTIFRTGRGKAALQGNSVPLGVYARAASRLLHIQSQYAQMELLDPERQLVMVDSSGGKESAELLSSLRRAFEAARLQERELRALTQRRAEIELRYANASEILPLVRKVNPEPGLENDLTRQMSDARDRSSMLGKARQNLDRLTGGLSEQGILDALKNASEALLSIFSGEERDHYAQLLHEGMQSFREITEDAERCLNAVEDVSLFNGLETRLGALRRLKRLAGAETEEALLAYCADAKENLEWLEGSYKELEEKTRQARELRREASRLALLVREHRKATAAKLERGVNSLLKELGMEQITFSIRLHELSKLRANGADEVEFLLTSEQRCGRVDKIASGGELSRLLLALQLALPDEWLPPTLVFDEVEAGLGGRAAVLSGLKLKELSRRCQVLLVTHEASIAALGDTHIVVRREGGESRVEVVEGQARQREIARMLSGSPDLEEALEHAQKLLEDGGRELPES